MRDEEKDLRSLTPASLPFIVTHIEQKQLKGNFFFLAHGFRCFSSWLHGLIIWLENITQNVAGLCVFISLHTGSRKKHGKGQEQDTHQGLAPQSPAWSSLTL